MPHFSDGQKLNAKHPDHPARAFGPTSGVLAFPEMEEKKECSEAVDFGDENRPDVVNYVFTLARLCPERRNQERKFHHTSYGSCDLSMVDAYRITSGIQSFGTNS